ncbi:MAG TPA: DUF6317 family protein [Pseudonocardiaceae bacterium]|jgi:hypothetical protein
MSGGYGVVMGDLQNAASTFHTESGIFKQIMPMAPAAPPSSGSGAFDGSLGSLVDAIGLLHLQIAGDMADNGVKLQQAHDNYQHTDETLNQLFGQIADPGKIK